MEKKKRKYPRYNPNTSKGEVVLEVNNCLGIRSNLWMPLKIVETITVMRLGNQE